MLTHAYEGASRQRNAHGSPSVHPVRRSMSDDRATALHVACAGMRVAAIVTAFSLDADNPTHVRRVQRWLVDGAPEDAIAMLSAGVRPRPVATFGDLISVALSLGADA